MTEDISKFYDYFLPEGIYLINEEESVQEVNEKEVQYSNITESESIELFDITFSGNNSSRLAILVYYPELEWISPKDKMFLERIIAALNINFESVALINIAKNEFKHFNEIISRLPQNKFISFKLPNTFCEGIHLNKYVIHKGVKTICMEKSLTDIAMEKDQKTILWRNMREMMGL